MFSKKWMDLKKIAKQKSPAAIKMVVVMFYVCRP